MNIFSIPEHVLPAHYMSLSHNGRTLATAGEDGFVRLWALLAGTELASIKGPGGHIRAVCFAPNDKMLACDTGAVLLADVNQSPAQ